MTGLESWVGADLQIERTANTEGALIENVGIDHSGFEVFVPEEFLDGADIIAIFEQVGCEAMAQGMAAYFFVDLGGADGSFERSLECSVVEMMAANDLASGVDGTIFGWECVLPDPVAIRVGIFSFEGKGEIHCAKSEG